MNSNSWQDGLFHGTKWRKNYQCSRLWCQIILFIIISVKRYYIFGKLVEYVLSWYKVYLEILKDEFKILTGRTFSRNKMARKLSVFSSLMSDYSFHNNFCQKIIIYLKSLYNKRYCDMRFIWKYWKMNSKSWQVGLFHGTKWRENYQCSRLWCQIILFIIISVKRYYIFGKLVQYVLSWYKVYLKILKDEFKILTGRTFSLNKMARKLSVFLCLI
jgi:membrane protein implicated in regulation of membrane protease activity